MSFKIFQKFFRIILTFSKILRSKSNHAKLTKLRKFNVRKILKIIHNLTILFDYKFSDSKIK